MTGDFPTTHTHFPYTCSLGCMSPLASMILSLCMSPPPAHFPTLPPHLQLGMYEPIGADEVIAQAGLAVVDVGHDTEVADAVL